MDVQSQLSDLDSRLTVTNSKVNEVKSTLTVYMLLLNRLNLPYGIDNAVRALVRLKMTVDLVIRSFVLLEAATTPWGSLKAFGLFAMAGVSAYSMLSMYESTTGT